MTALRIFLARLLGLFGGGTRRERELRAEIDGHIAEAVTEDVCQGMTPEEARYTARRQFGGVTQTPEAHRDHRRFTLLLTPVLQSFLIDLPANDPATFGAVAAALVAIALVASYVPARRATRIDPIATLRTE